MRIGVTGKGGSGKTTVAATAARVFARRGMRVNALDGDPNPNLARALGIPDGDLERLRPVPQDAVLRERTGEGAEKQLELTRPVEDLISEYGAVGPEGVRTLTMTGLLGAGRGCICGQHATVRGFVAELGTARPEEITILDTEASIEHLSRGTVRHVDTLLVVVEPYFRSLETLGRIAPMARDLGIPQVAAVANKVRSEDDERVIRDYAESIGVDVIAVIPFDAAVEDADRGNTSLLDHRPGSPAVAAVERLVDELMDRAGQRVAVASSG